MLWSVVWERIKLKYIITEFVIVTFSVFVALAGDK